MGLRLLRPDRKDETYRNGNLGGVRQWIEPVNDTLKGQFDLEAHGGHTPIGVFTRIAQRLLSMAAGTLRASPQLEYRRHQQTVTDRL